MSNIAASEQKSVVFALPAVMNIETADSLAAEFKQMPLKERMSLILDAEKIETITTPGLQLIVSLEKTLSAHGAVLEIRNQPEVMINVFKDTGLESLIKKAG